MEVIITGGQGFLGQELCRYLLRKGELTDSSGQVQPIQRITLLDTQPPPSTSIQDPKVSSVTGDVASMGPLPVGPLSVFHLAGVMSGAAEKDFDLGLRVNLDGTRSLLDACRARGAPAPKFIFTSSIAVFGETYGDGAVGDTDKVVPKNTYGMTKACGELLVNDYTRRGFVDGRTGRLPSVVVRPGKPNAATTSCYSGVIREPLHGVDVALPVARNLPHPVTSTRALIANLVILHDATWPKDLVDRACNLPSRVCTLQQLVDALYEVVPSSEHGRLGKISDQEDEFLSGVVRSMGSHVRHQRAEMLKMVEVPPLPVVVQEFLEDFGEKTVVSNKRQRVA